MTHDQIDSKITRLEMQLAALHRTKQEPNRSAVDYNRRTPITAFKVWFLGFAFSVALFSLHRGGMF